MNTLHHLLGDPIGLTSRERDSWDWSTFFSAVGRQDVAKLGFYRSCSDAVVAARGRPQEDLRTYAIPSDLFVRDLTVATGGAALVGTKNAYHLPTFLGRSLAATLPLRRIRGLRENVTIPRGLGTTTVTWLSDETHPTAEGNVATGQLSLSPKNVAALTQVSHMLDRQAGPEGAAYIVNELDIALGRALDAALLGGTGASGQPMSPFKEPGVGSAAGAGVDWSDICSLTTSAEAVSVGADKPSWVLGVGAASVLRQRERVAGNGGFIFDDGRIAGYQANTSPAAPTASIYLAAWDQIVMASWGSLEIMVNPFDDFTRGLIGIRAWMTVDYACLNPSGLSFVDAVS